MASGKFSSEIVPRNANHLPAGWPSFGCSSSQKSTKSSRPKVLALTWSPLVSILVALCLLLDTRHAASEQHEGQSVLLHCLVEPSSDLVVSWFRGVGEPQLLTSETNTLIDDSRFVVRHGLIRENDWALQIRNLDKSTDSGLYQCQTNTEPPQSQFYQLTVTEPQVSILGAPDMIVKSNAMINLTCLVSQSPGEMQVVFWYKNDKMINYSLQDRGKIIMSKLPHKTDSVISNLQIHGAKMSDSANYTCSPSGAKSSSIYVHVLEGLDKRLIMFQNDNYESSNQLAASSQQQQTNSALSVHVIRLSRGRVYALFVAFIILASWFHLVAQLQTAISLLLLAIIGFFIGKVTEPPILRRASCDKPCLADHTDL